MDFRRIDAAIASYASRGDEVLNARLTFFRALWEIQDSYASKAASTSGCQLDCERAHDVFEQVDPNVNPEKVFPLLEHMPMSIDKNLFIGAVKDLSHLFTTQESFDPCVKSTLMAFDWETFISQLSLELAGANPSAFLDSAMTLLEEMVAKDERIERPGFIITVLSLAVRAMLDGYAYDLMHAYMDTCPHETYYMDRLSYCPVCGSDATASYVGPTEADHGNSKELWCSQCGSRWDYGRIRCPHCLTTDQDKLHYLNVEGDEEHRVYICDKCHTYMRTYFESPNVSIFATPFSFEVEDVVMANLDLVAQDYLSK